MPEITDTTVPHEILIRFDEAGALSGAHYAKRRIVTLDGATILDEPQPPVPVALSLDTGAQAILDDVLGEALAAALAGIAERDATIAALEAAAPPPS